MYHKLQLEIAARQNYLTKIKGVIFKLLKNCFKIALEFN